MNDRITQILTKLFYRHWTVYRHDAKRELRNDSEVLSLPSIENLDPRSGCQGGVSHA